jgi:hypothetical protein
MRVVVEREQSRYLAAGSRGTTMGRGRRLDGPAVGRSVVSSNWFRPPSKDAVGEKNAAAKAANSAA